ncbi:MAG: hypothetical protein WCQ49_01715 [Candidatus Saccharibacteria bacterium]
MSVNEEAANITDEPVISSDNNKLAPPATINNPNTNYGFFKNKKRFIIIICSVFILAIALLVVSLLIKPPRLTEDRLRTESLSYLKEKYHEDFVIKDIEFGIDGWSDYIDGITASALNSNDEFSVEWYEENGGVAFSDSYYRLLIRDDYNAYLKDTLESLDIEAKAYIDTRDKSQCSAKLTKGVPLTKIYDLANKDVFYIKIYTNSEAEAKKVEQKLPQELVKSKLVSILRIVAYADKTYNIISSGFTVSDDNPMEDVLYTNYNIRINSDLEIKY